MFPQYFLCSDIYIKWSINCSKVTTERCWKKICINQTWIKKNVSKNIQAFTNFLARVSKWLKVLVPFEGIQCCVMAFSYGNASSRLVSELCLETHQFCWLKWDQMKAQQQTIKGHRTHKFFVIRKLFVCLYFYCLTILWINFLWLVAKISSKQFRRFVPFCPRFLMVDDSHDLCVVCLGVKYTRSVLEGADCVHCKHFSMKKALFLPGSFKKFKWIRHLHLMAQVLHLLRWCSGSNHWVFRVRFGGFDVLLSLNLSSNSECPVLD